MKIILLLLLLPFYLSSQTTESIINEVNLDSLVLTVRILSQEEPIPGFGLIPDRKSVGGRQITATFLSDKLKSYGLETSIINYRLGGNNVAAIQKGVKYPDSTFIISAHYDSVTEYCADDDASGTSTVLEAARILSKYQFDYSIIYALWDEEELGLIGSRNYADKAAENNDKIVGNLNMDMIGYDGNDDGLFEVHLNNSQETKRLYDEIVETYNENEFDLLMFTAEKGITNSDHSSFWRNSYGAILVTEAYLNDDFNPNYHTSDDRIAGFNLDYYHNISKLIVASMADLAVITTPTNVTENNENNSFQIYPNPVTDELKIEGQTFIIESLEIVDMAGQKINTSEIFDGSSLNTSYLSQGIYTLIIQTNSSVETIKFIKLGQ